MALCEIVFSVYDTCMTADVKQRIRPDINRYQDILTVTTSKNTL